ncbi:Uncharacterised protein [Mycobacteroides abscessus subsp. abscessus]|nr:Uncharacterised protein [Mycobacteroides abscessus subsp. abscessus]
MRPAIPTITTPTSVYCPPRSEKPSSARTVTPIHLPIWFSPPLKAMLTGWERLREQFRELLTNYKTQMFAVSTPIITNPGASQHFPLLWH